MKFLYNYCKKYTKPNKKIFLNNLKYVKSSRKLNNVSKNIFSKYKIKNRYKKKLKFSKDLKIKNKKSKVFNSHEINKGYLQYVNSLKNDKLNYIEKANNYRGFQYGKNCDIYDYLISPKTSVRVTEEAATNDYIEFKSINQ